MYIIQIMVAAGIAKAGSKSLGRVGTSAGAAGRSAGRSSFGSAAGSATRTGSRTGARTGARTGSRTGASTGARTGSAAGGTSGSMSRRAGMAAAGGTLGLYAMGRGQNDEKVEECTEACKPGGYNDWVTDNTKSLTFSETEGDSDQPYCTEAIFEKEEGDCGDYCFEKCDDAHGGFLNTVMDGVDEADVADVGIADVVDDVVEEGADVAGDVVDEGVDIAGDVVDEGLELGGDLFGDIFGDIIGFIPYVFGFCILIAFFMLIKQFRR